MGQSRKKNFTQTGSGTPRPFSWWKLIGLPLLALGACIPRLLSDHRDWVETFYSNTLYPPIKDALSSVTALVPFSVAEWVLYALILLVVVTVLGGLVRWLTGRCSGRRYLSKLLSLCVAAGLIWNLFYLTWGFNYFRKPLSERMELSVETYSVEQLEQITASLAVQANQLRENVKEDGAGVFTLGGQLPVILTELPKAYQRLSLSEPAFQGKTTRAKTVLYSEGLSWLGIRGIYVGLTAESNINIGQPDLLLPQSAAHEMAHQLGIASENEAEFAAHLACMASDDPRVQYSGVVSALITCGNALYSADPGRYVALKETYCPGLNRDLAAHNAYWDQYQGPIEEAASQANDNYLKHNAQNSGVKSYGEAVDLLLAYYIQTKN